MSEAKARIFFALWPDRTQAEAMSAHARAIAQAVGGRVTRTESIHLTLAFIGDVDAACVPRIAAVPDALRCEAFALRLDHLGFWRHNGVGWIAPSVLPQSLSELQRHLSAWLEDCGIALEKRPFKPHVTLVRRGSGSLREMNVDPIAWPVTSFVLVRSNLNQPTARYDVIQTYALAAGDPPAH